MGSLKRGNWSTHELERLRGLYPRSPEHTVARLLRRSLPSVQRKAREIFRSVAVAANKRREWTAEDDLRLREGLGAIDLASLSLVLQRPESDVAGRIDVLRERVSDGKPWRRTDVGMLKKLFGSRSDADLAISLGRPIDEITEKAESLCLSKDKGFLARAEEQETKRRMPRWDDSDIALLRQLYRGEANLELARRLQRSVASVANKANQLGLKKDPAVLREMGRRNVEARYRPVDES